MKHTLPFFITLLWATMAHAQQDYNKSPEFLKANSVWNFGTNAGYNFNTRTPFRQSLVSSEACASVSDRETGELLFYSNSKNCWNKTGALMGGGNGTLMGNETTAQGVCIVPFINDNSKYYVFTLEQQGGYGAPVTSPPVSKGMLSYSVVDMTLNKGLGKIPAGQRNIPVDSFLGEMMITVPGNNCDVWLLVHTIDSAVFKAYNITAAGFNPEPVISRTGTEIYGKLISNVFGANYNWGAYALGNMAVSPDRTKLALASRAGGLGTLVSQTGTANGTMVCKFEAGTGVVSDAIILDTLENYGVVFSPDNSKLYVSSSSLTLGTNLAQYDISNFNTAAIVSSKTHIKALKLGDVYGFKLYNDTIYLALGGVAAYPYMMRINNPNLAGLACNFQDSAVNLVPTTMGRYGLPNEVVFPYPPRIINELSLDTLLCAPSGSFPAMSITAPAEYKFYTWQDGLQVGDRQLTDPGTYWLTSEDGCHRRTDTFIVKHVVFEPPVITVNIHELGTTFPYGTYQWLVDGEVISGATRSVYTVLKNGNYQVIVSKGSGCIDTSDVYPVTNVTLINEKQSTADLIRIYPNPANDIVHIHSKMAVNVSLFTIEGKLVKNVVQATSLSLHELAAGVYLLHIYHPNGNLLKVEKVTKVQ